MAEITFHDEVPAVLDGASALFICGPAALIQKFGQNTFSLGLPSDLAVSFGLLVEAGIGSGSAFKPTAVSTAVLTKGSVKRLVLVPLADEVTRHVSPAQSYAITSGLASGGLSGVKGTAAIIMLPSQSEFLSASALGIGRSCPLYTVKTTEAPLSHVKCVFIGFRPVGAAADIPVDESLEAVHGEMTALRRAQALADMPAQECNTSQFEAAAHEAVGGVEGVTITSIVGKDLEAQGFGGIYNVGRAGVDPPRMVVLEFKPKFTETGPALGLVGKGIVFDSGGLDLKGSPRYMKGDMGGAAAVLGAFESVVKMVGSTGFSRPLFACLMLAENAIGPESYRPDDVLTMHSGKTVEVDNTDAEGRFLLADGLSYLAREKGVRWLVDAATLTGHAAGTGKAHAGVVSNDENLEQLAVASGLISGDHVMPMIFAPEILGPGLESLIADMKNTGDASQGAGSSAAGVFIWKHIEDVEDVRWLHVDLAGPALSFPPGSSRMTAFGVGLLTAMVLAEGSADWVGVTPLALLREMLMGEGSADSARL